MHAQDRLGALFAVTIAFVVGCARADYGPSDRARVPVVRFVDQAASGDRSALRLFGYDVYRRLGGRRPLRTAQLPSATIGNETRYVLVAPPFSAESLSASTGTPADDGTSLVVVLPDAFLHSRRALARVASRTGKNWSTTVHETLPVATDADGRPMIAVPRRSFVARDATAIEEVSVEAFGESSALALHRTSPIRVPLAAELTFGTGLVTGAESGTSVTFTVVACANGGCAEIFRQVVTPQPAAAERWRDHTVPLALLAGKEVSFEFRVAVAELTTDGLVLPLWSNPTVYAPIGAARPSVILVSLDTLRADRLPTYGYSRNTAPFLDETFSKNGTVLEDCTSAAASTPPGHMTIMTSLDPSVHGVRRGDETLDPTVATLAEVLRADGMTTGAVTENGWLVHGHGFGRGFDSYIEDRSVDIDIPQGAIERTIDASLEWLARHKDTPFFLFMHTYQVHDPYSPPAGYADQFIEPGTLASESLRYDQEIRYTDDRLRAFFVQLGELIDMARTIVVITSDHGEGFDEHGYSQHSAFLYQEVVHVPCLFWGAGIPRGRRVGAPVGTIDLAPTITRLVGAPRPRQFAGTDLSPLIVADDDQLEARLRARLLFSEAWGDFGVRGERREIIAIVAPGLAVRSDHLKAIRTSTPDAVQYEAYDLSVDPGELRNLLPADGAESVDELRRVLDRYIDESKKARARLLGVSVDTLPPDRPTRRTVAPATENKLRALGYLE